MPTTEEPDIEHGNPRSKNTFDKYDFLKNAILNHNSGQFIYFLNSFNGVSKKVKICCPVHGVFFQVAGRHLSGRGCKKCQNKLKAIRKRSSLGKFVEAANKKHFNFYNYGKSIYVKNTESVIITCPIHGDFSQRANDHLNGYGCPKCGIEKSIISSRNNLEDVVKKFNLIHGNRYDYSSIEYTGLTTPINIICPIHGVFKQKPRDHLSGSGCQKCAKGIITSKVEVFIGDFIKRHVEDQEVLFRAKPDWLNGKELDIYIPTLGIAIEFNGLHWHSEKFKDKWYHFDKTKKCIENNVKLLHIWEHYWNNPVKRKIYLYKILHLINLDEKVYAKKCEIKAITSDVYDSFVLNNHLEGTVLPYKDMLYFGLFSDDRLLMVAGYGYFYNQSKKDFTLKLQRICTLLGVTVVGGVSKLFRHISKMEPGLVVNFQITLDTGGSLLFGKPINREDVSLRYWWTKSNEYRTRNQCQKHILQKNSLWSNGDTEKSFMTRLGWSRVYDSGICNVSI